MSTISQRLEGTARFLESRLPATKPRVGLVLGSGLGSFADTLSERVTVDYHEIPGFVGSTVVGHAGRLVYGLAGKIPVLAMQGRVHFYEGHTLDQVVFPIRTLITLGCKTLVLTNAAGGIELGMSAGELVLIRDHLNLMGQSPLLGPNDDVLGPRFPDMTNAYDRGLRELAKKAGRAIGLQLREGVYAGLSGPAYETPAEVKMLRTLGADLAGMSTVPEVIAARHMGARVLGISCVTNLAAGILDQPLSHDEVTETATRVRGQFEQLLRGILGELAAERAP